MTDYTFSTNPGFATEDNVTLLNADIDSQITDNTRLDSQIIGDTIAVTFTSPLSQNSINIIHNIFNSLDTGTTRGDKIITLYPMINIKTSVYQIIARIPFHNYKITNIEVNGYMDAALTNYKVQIYDPVNDQIIAEKQLTNSSPQTSDLGNINNLPSEDLDLEVNVKITGNNLTNNSAYIESIVLYYN